MQMSSFRSGYTVNEVKGNHRRMNLPTGKGHGVTGNTCSTPANFPVEEL